MILHITLLVLGFVSFGIQASEQTALRFCKEHNEKVASYIACSEYVMDNLYGASITAYSREGLNAEKKSLLDRHAQYLLLKRMHQEINKPATKTVSNKLVEQDASHRDGSKAYATMLRNANLEEHAAIGKVVAMQSPDEPLLYNVVWVLIQKDKDLVRDHESQRYSRRCLNHTHLLRAAEGGTLIHLEPHAKASEEGETLSHPIIDALSGANMAGSSVEKAAQLSAENEYMQSAFAFVDIQKAREMISDN